MLKKKYLILAARVVGLVALIGAGVWAGQTLEQQKSTRPHFGHSTLTITRSDGTVFPFETELALSEQEQAYGLMFVRDLAKDRAMIFPYPSPREVAFWMKNTLIPLDMLFIRSNGTIGHIVADARPMDMTPISSQMPVIAVVEIAGGVAKQDGLSVGDHLQSPALSFVSP